MYSKSIATLCISKAGAATLQRILPPIYLLIFCKAQRFESESFYYKHLRYYCRKLTELHLLLFNEILEIHDQECTGQDRTHKTMTSG